MKYWLFKSDPESFSIRDFVAAPQQTTCWDGVRNYQARNYLRDDCKIGDKVLFYHSQEDPPAIHGIAKVVREAYPDPTAWDEDDSHYDPKSTPDKPIWFMVDIQLEQQFALPLALATLRAEPRLEGLELLRKGSRLSVQTVSAEHFKIIKKMAGK